MFYEYWHWLVVVESGKLQLGAKRDSLMLTLASAHCKTYNVKPGFPQAPMLIVIEILRLQLAYQFIRRNIGLKK